MMKGGGSVEAEFKGITWLENFPIDQYAPDPSKRFSITLSMYIGPKDLPGAEIFYVDVSNGHFLADEVRACGSHVVRSTILVEEFSVVEIERVVREFCKTCHGETWHEVTLLLMRLGRWEYEGMATP